MLTHRACLTNVVQMLTAVPVAYAGPILAVAPPSTPSAWSSSPAGPCPAARPWSRCPRLEVTGFLAALQDHHITQAVVVRPMVQALAKHLAAPRSTAPR
jgi:hypothetical protein